MDKIYQWSIKLDNGEIFVIHTDTVNDLKLKREELMIFISSLKGDHSAKEFSGEDIGENFEKEMEDIADASYCPVHKVTMKERDGRNGKFYSHARKLGDSWDYCNGKGWASEK